MDKLKTKILLISLLLVLLVSLQGVSAVTEDNENLASESIDLSICDNTDDANPDKLSTADTSNGQEEVLSTTPTPFSELYEEIATGGKYIELAHDYYAYEESDPTIEIYDDIVIDGKGAVIDMAESNIRAFYINSNYGVTIKNLTIKNVNYDKDGGDIYFYESSHVNIMYCNFINNTASGDGGAIYFGSTCHMNTVTNCNFTDNQASGDGGAVYFEDDGTVTNCNFNNNTAYNGGAIDIGYGIVENCSFSDNSASGFGGAIRFRVEGTVTNCSFSDNSAGANGGAIFAFRASVENCNFTVNTANPFGGAIYVNNGIVENCNFTDNTASGDGGAIFFSYDGNVTNCNFTGNNAINGSAIYFWTTSATNTVSNSRFLNNRANAEALEVTKNDNNITITFTGKDNLLNAIYSEGDVTFTNVFYWSAEGITNTGSSAIKPSRSNKEAGQNITLEIYDSDCLVDNVTLVTDANGQVSYDLSKLGRGKYRYKAYHPDDSYYTYAVKEDSFTNGMGDFNILQSLINRADANSVLTLDRNYTFTIGMDENLTDGIVIDKPITINGNGYTINALQKARIFNITSDNVVLNNITFTNATTSGDGGAVYFYKNSEGNVTNCNFVNNSAKNGGAIYFNGDITNVTVHGCFKGNNAERVGGAIYVKGKSMNNNFSSQFYDNNARQASGGAIFFYSLAENNSFESIFMNNYALYGGGIFLYKQANDNNFDSNFTSNIAESCGGAIFFYSTTNNNNFTGYFTNNSALGQVDPTVGNGGAITFKDVSTNCVFNCEFINNTAALNGGGVNYRQTPHNITLNCNFINNNAPSGGGVNFFESFENIIFNGEFINNSAVNGGAIAAGAGSIKEVSFKRNHAENGGAIYFANAGEIIKCSFTDNSAKNGGAVYFSNSSGTVENCNFTGNNATTGSAIYFESTSGTKTVSNSILLNNRANAEALEVTTNNNNTTIAFTGKDNLLNAIYSNSDVTFTNVVYWSAEGIANTGSSAIKPSKSKNEAGQNITVCVAISGELVLNEVKVTDEDGKIVLDVSAGDDYFISVRHDADSYYTEAEKTIHKTFSVNVTSQTSTNRTVNITAKSNIPNEIIKGELQFILPDSAKITANYTGNGNWWALYTFADYGVYEVNASYTGLDKVAVNNANITVNKANSTLTVRDIVFDYNSTGSTSVSFTGATGVNASVIRQPNANVSVDGNMITVSGLNAGNYTLNVTTIADADHNNVTKTAKITVNKIDSTLTVENIVFDYNSTGSTSVTFTGATGVNASVVDQPNAVVDVEGNIITVSGLDAGNYTLTVTTIADANHNNVTRTAKVTVNKINSTLTVDNVIFDYNSTGSTSVSYDGATGVNANVVNQPNANVNVNVDTITVSGLDAGNYTLTVTTIADANHNNVTRTAKVTVNKINSTLTVDNVIFDYNSTGSTSVSYDGATGVNANVVNQPNANVNVNVDTITVSGLDAGNYTLTATTIADTNHNNITKTAKVTVNKVDSTLTVGDIAFNYGDSGSGTISFTGATGVIASVVDQPNAVVDVDVDSITVSGLDAGNYTLTATTIADTNHNNITKTAKVTVNKIDSTLTVENVIFDYGDSGSATISFTGATGVNASIIGQPDAVVDVEGNTITVSNLDAGNYTLTATTIADANHNNVTKTADVTVRHVVFITIDSVTGYAGEVVNVTAQFKYENGDLVNEGVAGLTIRYADEHLLAASLYSISSADEYVPVSDGKATFNVLLGAPGTYPYVVTYSSEDTDDAQAESTLTILKAATTVSGVDISGKPGDEKNITVTVSNQDNKSVENGTVTLTLNGKVYNAIVENGKALFSVELPSPGEYNVTVTYDGNDYYNSSSSSISVDVEKLNTKDLSAEDVSGKAGEKTDIRVEIVDEKGNSVRNGTATLTVDGKTYTAEVVDGAATFKDVVLPDKDTVADVYYHGNDYYNASSATFSIKVKHDNNNTEPDSNNTSESNNTVENKTAKHASAKVVDGNATGNPMAILVLALFTLVITYRKKIKL